MRTLGVDMASQPNKTGVARITWLTDRAVVEDIDRKADDARLDRLAAEADAIGVDAPFGWPRSFNDFLAEHRRGLLVDTAWSTARRDDLRFRRTDRRVHERTGRWPLSVSSDLISIPAMRCAAFLARQRVGDRSGDGRVYEVYPAAALTIWGFSRDSYKGDQHPARTALLAELRRRAPWLELSAPLAERCVASDDCLDALLAALIARAAVRGLTVRPAPDDLELAREEGWIALPLADSLARLMEPPLPGAPA
ncbi:MAG: DUF429 domain-containing protein [Myxococcales bacterium]|nr:DUF429 domain-containing protein [Myxococcales bacterium]